jgi:SOS-response transcriptional repressor LexA
MRTTVQTDTLTDRQAAVLRVVADYYLHTGEPCSVRYIARRLRVSHQRVHQHLTILRDRKWLEGTRPVRTP